MLTPTRISTNGNGRHPAAHNPALTALRLAGGLVAAGTAAIAAYNFFVRPWERRWGATDVEVQRPFPGDHFVPQPRLEATHAVTIQAPPEQVWPWLVQMGQGRGGLYSYDWLENAAGLNIHSADHILPEYQNLKVGDVIPLEPGGDGPPVVILEPNRALVMAGRADAHSEGAFALKNGDPNAYFSVSWGFYLEDAGDQTTRLIERFRLDWNPTLANNVAFGFFLEPAAFLMERKMLLGIKERVEATLKSPAALAGATA
jgi:hypothetical protein